MDEDYPNVAIVVSSSRQAGALNRYVENKKDDAFIEDDDLIITTVTAIDDVLY